MKKIIVLVMVVFLILIIVSFTYAEQKHFKGYGIETWTNGDKLTVKTDNGEFTVKILAGKFTKEQSFAFHCWNSILSVHLTEEMEINDKIKAVEKIQSLVEVLAIRIKTGKMEIEHVSVELGDIGKALNVFWKMFFVAADRLVGNEDGFCTDAEIYKLEMSLQSRVVAVMTRAYLK